MTFPVYGDTCRLTFAQRILQANRTLINLDRVEGPWLVTLAPLTNPTGGPVAVTGIVTYQAELTMLGHAGRETSAIVDWPLVGGTFACSGSSLRLAAGLSGSLILPNGNYELPVQFTAWAVEQDGSRQTYYAPRRSVFYGNLAASPAVTRFALPRFACSYYLQVGNALAGAQVQARFYDSAVVPQLVRGEQWDVTVMGAGPQVRVGLTTGGGQSPWRHLPTPPDAQFLELESSAAINRVRVVYELDLG